MRLPFLLVLVPLVAPGLARGDASTPGKAGKTVAAPALIEYYQPSDGGPTVATLYAPGTPLYLVSNGSRVELEGRQEDGHYLVKSGGFSSKPTFLEVTPYGFVIGGKPVTVGFGKDFQIHVRAAGGAELAVEAAGQGFLSRKGGNVSAELVDKGVPAPFIKISSRPEACSDFWDIYVSVVDGVPKNALELDGIADPPAMSSSTVKFGAGGTAVVTTRTSEDDEGKKVRVERKRYRFDAAAGVYTEVSKRGSAISK